MNENRSTYVNDSDSMHTDKVDVESKPQSIKEMRFWNVPDRSVSVKSRK